jgi:hypothetical protein
MIYFLQRADGLIKIGTTNHYPQRLRALEKEEGKLALLGWAMGGMTEEGELHDQFALCRATYKTEWFHPTPVLLAHIEEDCEKEMPAGDSLLDTLLYLQYQLEEVSQMADVDYVQNLRDQFWQLTGQKQLYEKLLTDTRQDSNKWMQEAIKYEIRSKHLEGMLKEHGIEVPPKWWDDDVTA